MTAWTMIAGSVLIVAGVAFVYWPAALIVAGALLAADATFELRKEDS